MKSIKEIKIVLLEIFYTPKHRLGLLYKIDDIFIPTLIFINLICIILESFSYIHQNYSKYLHYIEIFSIVVFTIEYLIRIWVSDLRFKEKSPFRARVKYIFSPLGIIDGLSIFPFYISLFFPYFPLDNRILRIIRLFRIFKLSNYFKSLQLVIHVINAQKREILITLLASILLMIITATVMFEVESKFQPDKFTDFFQSFWWSVNTLTTIGYGDIIPQSFWGKIIGSITAIFGIGIVAVPAGIISAGFLQELEKEKRFLKNSKKRNYIFNKKERTSRKNYNINKVESRRSNKRMK